MNLPDLPNTSTRPLKTAPPTVVDRNAIRAEMEAEAEELEVFMKLTNKGK